MYLALIIFPLLGSISSGFFGRKIGVTGSQLLTCMFVLITTIFSIMSFFEVGFNNIAVTVKLFK
jgi:NADH-ubiquinone oxidoreductase chain 5